MNSLKHEVDISSETEMTDHQDDPVRRHCQRVRARLSYNMWLVIVRADFVTVDVF